MEKCHIASSTMEVENVACYEATCHAIWLRNFISTLEIVHSISRPLKLFCDNPIAVFYLGTLGSVLALSTLM